MANLLPKVIVNNQQVFGWTQDSTEKTREGGVLSVKFRAYLYTVAYDDCGRTRYFYRFVGDGNSASQLIYRDPYGNETTLLSSATIGLRGQTFTSAATGSTIDYYINAGQLIDLYAYIDGTFDFENIRYTYRPGLIKVASGIQVPSSASGQLWYYQRGF